MLVTTGSLLVRSRLFGDAGSNLDRTGARRRRAMAVLNSAEP